MAEFVICNYTIDQANRLKSATIAGATSTYTYDGDGKRVSKTVGGVTTSYVYDANRSLPDVLTDGSLKYVYGLGLAYAVERWIRVATSRSTTAMGSAWRARTGSERRPCSAP